MNLETEQHSTQHSSGLPWILGSAALGALLMHLADPNRGRRRRALALDQMRSASGRAREVFESASRDFGNRLRGLLAEVRHLKPGTRGPVDDPVLLARVRQKIGRIVSNPHAIKVSVHSGGVTLRGPVLDAERRGLLHAVRAVAGVRGLDDHLQVSAHLPGVEVGAARRDRDSVARGDWPPVVRTVTLLGGGALGTLGLLRRSPITSLFALAGLALAARGIVNWSATTPDAGAESRLAGRRDKATGHLLHEAVQRGEGAQGTLH